MPLQVEPSPLEPLLRHMQMGLQISNCEKAEFALSRAELDARIGEFEARLRSQQLSNAMLFRRVEMLEQVLQIERLKRESLQKDLGSPPQLSTPLQSPRQILAQRGSESLEASLRA
eukprot:CAMPEP_0197667866 /NCGR_PEP_ID=MMETSP1338-20131121/67660_1 /TAXON_ID=43686 ORGANISM="Pelagodinium beii, Strain RCC1491" /NCGR_SAMPLE_ID=MMETSP1338 /ASSEMBLY_ACC=CAM_ASM_000754 /LENGTH=115 /DNA_ID=CAMNT_0043247201 /DNA_START=1 /DNA_END=344 /DNA_ORIENTATION=+